MSEIILHHYDRSPFSEKVRVVFGIKGLAWRSVVIPVIMPKPDLMPLTGGYRRTPVMQIGADVYCDTQLIARELERRFPTPTLFPQGDPGTAWGFSMWTDRPFFQATVSVIFGAIGHLVPEDFKRDRAALFGDPARYAEMETGRPAMLDQWRACAGWLEAQLADGRPFLTGEKPGLADASAYLNVWFLRGGHPPSAESLLAECPRVVAWADRVAGLGHGRRSELDAAAALEIARDAAPAAAERADAGDPNGLEPGRRVAVAPDDYGRDPVEGVLVSSSAQHVAVRREDPRVGTVVVHFPRAGFVVRETAR